MDGYQFAADIFKSLVSLAWPAAAVVAVCLFQDKLSELMPLLRLKYKDIDISFKLDQVEKDVKELPPAPPSPPPSDDERTRFERVAQVSPRAAILDMRYALEEALNRVVEARLEMARPGSKLPAYAALKVLRDHGIINTKTAKLLAELRDIGNQTAHSRGLEPTEADALRFQKMVNTVIPVLHHIATSGPEAGKDTP